MPVTKVEIHGEQTLSRSKQQTNTQDPQNWFTSALHSYSFVPMMALGVLELSFV